MLRLHIGELAFSQLNVALLIRPALHRAQALALALHCRGGVT